MLRLKKPRTWWLWVSFWALLFVIMHVPVPERALTRVHVSDKVIHFVAYLLLTGLGSYHLRRSTGSVSIATGTRWAVVYVVYAALDEWLQGFVHRSPSVEDWLADSAGVLIATTVAVVLWRRSLNRPLGANLGG